MPIPFKGDELKAKTVEDAVKVIRTRIEFLNSDQAHWRNSLVEIRDYILPDHGKDLVSGIKTADTSSSGGLRKDKQILNNTATLNLNKTVKGVHAGLISPGLQWFKLVIKSELDKENTVSENKKLIDEYGDMMEDLIYAKLADTNFYDVAYQHLLETFGFGVGCTGCFYDEETSNVYFEHLTAGEYLFATDYRSRVNAIYRIIWMTVANIVARFGEENVSDMVLSKYNNNKRGDLVAIYHVVEPNEEELLIKSINKEHAYRSFYIERDGGSGKVLQVKGFKNFPYFLSRLKVISGNLYGYGLGRAVIADVKQLQEEERRLAHANEIVINPPVQGPGNVLGGSIDLSPGAYNPVDSFNGSSELIRPILSPTPNIQAARASINQIENRIRETLMTDIFAPFTAELKSHITATEIAVRQQQNLQLSGPEVFGIVFTLLKPVVEYVLQQFYDNGVAIKAPEELADTELDVEFIAPLMVSLRSASNDNIQKFIMIIAQLMQMNPQLAPTLSELINWTKTARIMADNLSIPNVILNSDEALAKFKEDRELQQQISNETQGAGVAVDLAKAAQLAQQAGLGSGGM